MTTILDPEPRQEWAAPEPPAGPVATPPDGHRGPAARLLRGRPEDPAWVRPALLALLAGTALTYLWSLAASGWGNAFYAAAVQAGTKSWKAFFFGSSDAANFITVDKPPAALWVMELSARIFGVNSWSLLVPQALEGVATVALVYAAVRRWFRPGAGLLAGLVVATTPVAALMFRYDNPDALLVLLLTLAGYALVRALERGSTWWLVLAASAVGFGFITKMLQAFLVVPALAVVFLLAAPIPLRRRLGRLAVAGVAGLVSAGWWVAAVVLTPAADRPYIGGSQDNNLLNLIFGYNGFGRLSGAESGSVTGGPGGAGGGATLARAASPWGPTGWLRLAQSDFGGQVAWLIPAALIFMVACLWLWRRAPRTDRRRAAVLLWGGTLLVSAAVISFAQGIIHPYYTVALAPAVGALVGIGASSLWASRDAFRVRILLAATTLGTVVWAFALLDRAPGWLPWLRWSVLFVGVVAGAGLLMATTRLAAPSAVAAVGAVAAGLAGPFAFTLDTAATAHGGAIPSAGPVLAGARTGPGGGGPGGPGGFPGGGRPGAGNGTGPAAGGGFGPPPGQGTGNGFAGRPFGGRAFPRGGFPGGGFPGAGTGGGTPGGTPGSTGPFAGTGPGRVGRARAGGTGGGFLNASRPSVALVQLLEQDANRYTWVAATVNSNNAAGYQLATGDPVMAIGGFNGTDPAPSLAQFERYVAEGKVHFFIPGGGGLAGGGPGGAAAGTTTVASQITSWVESHFTATTVGGTTVYTLHG